MLMTNVYVGWPGSVHDARVLRNSELHRKAEQGELLGDGKLIIGDSAGSSSRTAAIYPGLMDVCLQAPFRTGDHQYQ